MQSPDWNSVGGTETVLVVRPGAVTLVAAPISQHQPPSGRSIPGRVNDNH